MKNRLLKFILLIVIVFPCIVFAYVDGDDPVTTSKIYNFLLISTI